MDPTSPLLLPSPGARKAVTEKLPGGHEEAEDDHPGASDREKTLWGQEAGHRVTEEPASLGV